MTCVGEYFTDLGQIGSKSPCQVGGSTWHEANLAQKFSLVIIVLWT